VIATRHGAWARLASELLQRANGRVKTSAQLIQAVTDAHLWGREYDREAADILKLQGDVARAVADEVRIQVTAEERARLAAARRVDPAAHEEYLLGRYYHLKSNEEDSRRAIEHFERAIRLEPKYAATYAGLSAAWRELGLWGGNFRRERDLHAPPY
jgi:tetratricopeptide (TPR) repeat protein